VLRDGGEKQLIFGNSDRPDSTGDLVTLLELRVQMDSARWRGDDVSSHSVGRWRLDGPSIPFKV